MDALKARDVVQVAALVQKRGGVDAVTFLRGGVDEQAVWMAALELDIEWEREAAEKRAQD